MYKRGEGWVSVATHPSPLLYMRTHKDGSLGALLFYVIYNTMGLVTAFAQGNCAIGSIEVKWLSAFYRAAFRLSIMSRTTS
jgi:hypothetical protein